MTEPELISAATLCASFPVLKNPVVNRLNIIQTIDGAFDRGADSVCLEGQDGIGKTTTLALFVNSRPDRSVSVFLRPSSRWAHDPAIVALDLATQLTWLLTSEVVRTEELTSDQSTILGMFYKLGRRAAARRQRYFVIVDGLADPGLDPTQLTAIRDLLPFGNPAFRFLLSGDLSRLPQSLFANPRTFPLPSFTIGETQQLLNELVPDQLDLAEFHKACRGIPIYLASVRRLLESGMVAADLLRSSPSDLANIFDLEWQRFTTNEGWHEALLAIVAHDPRPHSISSLSTLLKQPFEAVESFVDACSLLERDAETVVRYASDVLKRIGEKRLQHRRTDVLATMVDVLNIHPQSRDAVMYLPNYYKLLGRVDDVLTVLSPQFIQDAVRITQSVSIAQRHADIGADAARASNKPAEVVRFQVLKSALIDAASAGVDEAEIRAYAALHLPSRAIAIAHRATVIERRFQGLAVALSALNAEGHPPDHELINELKGLFDQVDVRALGDEAVGVAAALLDIAPELALRVVERVAESEPDANALDRAFLRLTLLAGRTEGPEARSDAVERIRLRIANPRIRGVSTVMAFVTRLKSANDVIRHAASLESADDRVFLSRLWLRQNPRRGDAVEVATYALAEAVAASEVALTSGVLRELSEPLKFAPSRAGTQELVGAVDAQIAHVAERGPTLETLRVRLNLAVAVAKTDSLAAVTRLEEAHRSVDALTDPSLRAAGIARILAVLPDIDQRTAADEAEREVLADQIRRATSETLTIAADHFGALEETVLALAPVHYSLAKEICSKLNSYERRDQAFGSVAVAITAMPLESWRVPDILDAVNSIHDRSFRHLTLARAVYALATTVEIGTSGLPTDQLRKIVGQFLKPVESMHSPELRAFALSRLLAVLGSAGDEARVLRAEVSSKMLTDVGDIEVRSNLIDVAFDACAALAIQEPAISTALLEIGAKNARDSPDASKEVADTVSAAVRLAVRAFRGLLVNKTASQHDEARLCALIETCPSPIERAKHFSDVAIHLRMSGESSRSTDLVGRLLRPLVAAAGSRDAEMRDRVIRSAVPGLYVAHPADAISWCERLDPSLREWAYYDICRALLIRAPPDEPVDYRLRRGVRLKYPEARDVVSVMKNMTHDGLLYELVRTLSDSFLDDRNKYALTEENKISILEDVRRIVRAKLPAPGRISHDGYRLLAEAELARHDRHSHDWPSFGQRAKSIPNIADRALVLAILARMLPAKEQSLQPVLVREAEAATEQISIPFERVSRLHDLASSFATVDDVAAKRLVNRGFKAGLALQETEARKLQREFIDVAYRIEPEFARSLGSLVDQDPARQAARGRLTERIKFLDTKRSLRDGEDAGAGTRRSRRRLAEAAWELLGQLTAEAMTPLGGEEIARCTDIASQMGLREGYHLWAWIVENSVQRYEGTAEAPRRIRPLFDAFVATGQVLRGIECGVREISVSQRSLPEQKTVVPAGDRDMALRLLREWCAATARDRVVVCDPYFGPPELRIIQEWKLDSSIRVQVVTSRRQQSDSTTSLPEVYRQYWRRNVGPSDPPEVEITVVGYQESGQSPIHDRYIVSGGAALRLGTSLNGLGGDQDSSISECQGDELVAVLGRVEEILSKSLRHVRGQRVIYEVFDV